jgi:hypothetical protein
MAGGGCDYNGFLPAVGTSKHIKTSGRTVVGRPTTSVTTEAKVYLASSGKYPVILGRWC